MCILLVKLIKKLQNIILPDALLTWANPLLVKFGSDRESNIPYLSICSAHVAVGRVKPNIKLIDTCGSRLTASRQSLNL